MFIHIPQDLNKDIFNFENFGSIILFARYTLFFVKQSLSHCASRLTVIYSLLLVPLHL